jgi:ornithine cyclodeaminase/alanine dehydrogenase-like protein (mu-crystallin family)
MLTEDDVKARIDAKRIITVIEEAFRDRYPATLIPIRIQMNLAQGVFLVMPCYDRGGGALGMKLATVSQPPSILEERVHSTYFLLDPKTGVPNLVISARYLTEMRTAATSAVATKFLAREDVRVLGIFGTGHQAHAHLRVLPLVRRFERFLVSGSDPGRSQEFAAQMTKELHAPVEAVSSRTCAAESEVLCTCTTSQTPLFDGNLLRPGTHLNLVGAFQPHAREVDDVTVQRSRIVVDTYEGAVAEAGDIVIPLKKGLITRNHFFSDLHELVSGKKNFRASPEEISLFKSVGCALEDLAVAQLFAAEGP